MRPDFNLETAILKFVLIYLLAVSIFSTLVFAQNSNISNGTKEGEEYFVLIETQGSSLNVRKGPSSLSPLVYDKLVMSFHRPS